MFKMGGSVSWIHMPAILLTQEPEEEDGKFEASLSNLVRPCLKIKFKKG